MSAWSVGAIFIFLIAFRTDFPSQHPVSILFLFLASLTGGGWLWYRHDSKAVVSPIEEKPHDTQEEAKR